MLRVLMAVTVLFAAITSFAQDDGFSYTDEEMATMSYSATANERLLENGPLNPYTTDGCSNWPDGWAGAKKTQWRHCCIIHDVAYWMGGTKAERKAADRELGRCVGKSGPSAISDIMGFAMNVGVRVGGSAKLPTTWRWGYGWNYNRGYAPLTAEERTLVYQLMPDDPLKVEVTSPGIFAPIPPRKN